MGVRMRLEVLTVNRVVQGFDGRLDFFVNAPRFGLFGLVAPRTCFGCRDLNLEDLAIAVARDRVHALFR